MVGTLTEQKLEQAEQLQKLRGQLTSHAEADQAKDKEMQLLRERLAGQLEAVDVLSSEKESKDRYHRVNVGEWSLLSLKCLEKEPA